MNVTGKTRIFRKDFNGRPSYSRAIASKEYKDGHQTDNWIRAYEPVQMPRGTELEDGITIEVISGFEAAYRMQNGSVGRKLVVTKFKVEGEEEKRCDGGDLLSVAGFDPYDDDIPF